MITTYRLTQDGLTLLMPQPQAEFPHNAWMRVVEPTQKELERLSEQFRIPLDFLTDPLDADEIARIETDDDCRLIILRIPVITEEGPVLKYSTVPIGIIFTEDVTVTICSRQYNAIDDFVNAKSKHFTLHKRNHFVLQIFLRTALLYLRILKEINNRSNAIQDELRKSMKNEELIRLLDLEKSLVFLTTSLKSNEIMMEKLRRSELVTSDDEEFEMLEDVIIEYRQAIEMANIYSNILTGMMDAFASVISNNLNIVMKFLTTATILVALPTLVASVFGMNLALPMQEWPWPWAFIASLGLMFTPVVIFVLLFRKKKYL